MEIGRGFEGMLLRENLDFTSLDITYILRYVKAHKLDNNIDLKPSQWAVVT